MAITIAEVEPKEIIAGDTVKFLTDLSDYPASAWTLTYTFVSRESKKVSVAATASSAAHLVTISAAVTANMSPGLWTFQGRVSNATESYTVRTGSVTVASNLSAVPSVHDARTHARKMVDLIEAQLEGRALDGVESHTIGGEPISLIPFERLIAMRDQYRAEVIRQEQAEQLRRGIGGSRNVYVRFS